MNSQLRKLLKEQEKIHKLARERMKIGYRRHGSFHPEKDKRDFYQEMKEEALDIRNYADMLFMKIEAAEKQSILSMKKQQQNQPAVGKKNKL